MRSRTDFIPLLLHCRRIGYLPKAIRDLLSIHDIDRIPDERGDFDDDIIGRRS